MKALLSEGLATFYAGLATGASEASLLWIDMFDVDRFQAWKEAAVAARPAYAQRLQRFVCTPEAEPDLTADLLYVLEFKDLDEKRFGYWYGYEIAASMHQSSGNALAVDYPSARAAVFSYFGVSESCSPGS